MPLLLLLLRTKIYTLLWYSNLQAYPLHKHHDPMTKLEFPVHKSICNIRNEQDKKRLEGDRCHGVPVKENAVETSSSWK